MKFKIEVLKNKINYFLKDGVWFLLAMRMPRKLVYYAIIRAWAYSTSNTYTDKTPDECTWAMVLKDSDKF